MSPNPPLQPDVAAIRRAVVALTSHETPVVTSEDLWKYFEAEGVDRNRVMELADEDTTGLGQIRRWKKMGPPNSPIGYSFRELTAEAEVWAASKGWASTQL